MVAESFGIATFISLFHPRATTSMTEDQVKEIIAGLLNSMITSVRKLMEDNQRQAPEGRAEGTVATTDHPRKVGTPKLDLKNFARMNKLSGGECAWKEWPFDLKVLTASINPSMDRWFGICETTLETSTPEKVKALYAMGIPDPKDLEARSKKLLGIFCVYQMERPRL